MWNVEQIKGIIFDYGGTIDSNGKHWAEVLWEAYEDHNVPVTKDQFREAYVYGERHLAINPLVQPEHTFYDLLKIKITLQFEELKSKKYLPDNDNSSDYILAISNQCYNFVRNLISEEKPFLSKLHEKYPMILVSNFYGNVQAVLKDFDIIDCFDNIIESAVVGIRKPDPAIFALGVEQINLPPSEIVVIGDSYTKDIVPAQANGCKTIWLKGKGWEKDDDNATADIIISDFKELRQIFSL